MATSLFLYVVLSSFIYKSGGTTMKVLIQGYSGKTGSEIYHLFLEKGVSVLGADKEKDISNFFNEEVGFIIDFSSLEGTKKAVEMALE